MKNPNCKKTSVTSSIHFISHLDGPGFEEAGLKDFRSASEKKRIDPDLYTKYNR